MALMPLLDLSPGWDFKLRLRDYDLIESNLEKIQSFGTKTNSKKSRSV
jgi:hypothetical protein